MGDGQRDTGQSSETSTPSIRDIIRLGRQADGARSIEALSQQALELFEPGERIPGSQYEVVRSLGEGDSAVLYEVQHQQIRRRAVAKILKSSLRGKPEGQRRFRDAARAVNEIGSPNIVEIFDFVTLPDRRVMLIMEQLEGETVAAAAASAPMVPERGIGILRQACKALAAAHAVGHVHQNLEPGNIMLVEAGRRADTVKLLGFAFGVPVEAGRRYASPEELIGSDADLRADVYALGCTAHWMLTGVEARLGQPSTLPGPLAAVVERCLSEEPAHRYADMADLEAALCEAQIELGLVTPWDDLPVPEVETQRREHIAAGMAALGRVEEPARRRWLLPAVGLAAVLAIGGITLAVISGDDVSTTAGSEVDALVSEARAAAAKAYFVYPSPKEPEHPTAYSRVVELESLEGDEQAPARARATELREEFAGTLFRLGDHYWDEEGGRRFARAYYEQGLMFDPDHAQALERAEASPEQIARRGESAAELRFDEEELADAEPLLVLAEEDPQARKQRMGDLRKRRRARAEAEDAALEALSESAVPALPKEDAKGSKGAVSAKARRSGGRGRNERDRVVALLQSYLDSAEDDAEAEAIESLLTVMGKRRGGAVKPASAAADEPAPPPPKASRRDSKAAARHVKAGRKKLKAGDYKGAEQSFHRALEADHRSAAAKAGLGEAYFERGAYQKAVTYHRQAVSAAPRNSSYRMRLGDAYFKVLRYRDAKKQYAKAKSMGHRDAKAALAKVDKRLKG